MLYLTYVTGKLFSPFPQVVGTTVLSTMVQKYQSPVRVYKQPFELVMAVSGLSAPHPLITLLV